MDIGSMDDIRLLVNSFYSKVQQDDLIGPVFNRVIDDRWPQHLEKMYTFWQTVLLGAHTYGGSPFPPHAKLPIKKDHFERWIEIFNTSVDSLFAGEKATEAKWRAQKMALLFISKLEYYQDHPSIPLV